MQPEDTRDGAQPHSDWRDLDDRIVRLLMQILATRQVLCRRIQELANDGPKDAGPFGLREERRRR